MLHWDVQDIQNHINMPHKFLSHLPLVSGTLWSCVQVWFIFCGLRFWLFLVNQRTRCYSKSDVCCYCCVATRVPESAEFKLCFRFSWLRFKLHLEVPDLNVAVVLMRGTMAFSEPVRERGREPYNFDLFIYQLKLRCCCAWSFVRQSVKTDANQGCEVLA